MQRYMQLCADACRYTQKCAHIRYAWPANQLTNQLGVNAVAEASVPQQRLQYIVQILPQGSEVKVQSKDHLRNGLAPVLKPSGHRALRLLESLLLKRHA